MEFNLSEEQKMIQDMARKFAQEEVAPKAAELDEKAEFPLENARKMGELGLMGMMIDPKWGGSGLDMVSYVLALAEISKACASTGVTMSVNNSLYCGPIDKYATDAQKEQYLTPFASGQKIGAYCLSEPGCGSDAAALTCAYVKKGDKYILNGTKAWITSGPNADAMVVFATSDKSLGYKGISAFIVDKDHPGFAVGNVEKKLGIRASSTSQIVLENCEVPEGNLLGEEGKGFNIAMNTLDYGRIGIATQALGISQAALEVAVQYAKEREAFGKPINRFQAIQWMIADMSTKINASELLIMRAAWRKDQGMNCTKEASQAKLFASEASNFCTNKAVQILGGYGYSREYPAERLLRDARITEIYEGTSEVQRLVIAREECKD